MFPEMLLYGKGVIKIIGCFPFYVSFSLFNLDVFKFVCCRFVVCGKGVKVYFGYRVIKNTELCFKKRSAVERLNVF